MLNSKNMYIKIRDDEKEISPKEGLFQDENTPISVKYLQKPQRIKNYKKDVKDIENELLRNTQLNNRIGDYQIDEQMRPEEVFRKPMLLDISDSIMDEIVPFEPVYKKSGEMLKSSLKNRSLSLPSTPNLSSIKDEQYGKDGHILELKRSKSVHFDKMTPTAYFHKDASPIDIQVEAIDHLSLNEDNKNNIHLSGRAEKGNNSIDQMVASSRRLRKSKKQAEFARQKRFGATPNREMLRLYSENFQILNTVASKTKKVLKINIFIKLSTNSYVFLEELLIRREIRGICIVGQVLVKNIHYNKTIKILYTWNRWQTYHEIEAHYLGTGDSILPFTNMDLFQFVIDSCALQDHVKNDLELCIRYITSKPNEEAQEEYWDNNNGNNYKVAVFN